MNLHGPGNDTNVGGGCEVCPMYAFNESKSVPPNAFWVFWSIIPSNARIFPSTPEKNLIDILTTEWVWFVMFTIVDFPSTDVVIVVLNAIQNPFWVWSKVSRWWWRAVVVVYHGCFVGTQYRHVVTTGSTWYGRGGCSLACYGMGHDNYLAEGLWYQGGLIIHR